MFCSFCNRLDKEHFKLLMPNFYCIITKTKFHLLIHIYFYSVPGFCRKKNIMPVSVYLEHSYSGRGAESDPAGDRAGWHSGRRNSTSRGSRWHSSVLWDSQCLKHIHPSERPTEQHQQKYLLTRSCNLHVWLLYFVSQNAWLAKMLGTQCFISYSLCNDCFLFFE